MGLWGGIFNEQIVTVLCRVAETAIACKWVLMLILFWGISFLIRIDIPPEALCPVSIMYSYCSKVFMFSLSLFFEGFLETYGNKVEFGY